MRIYKRLLRRIEHYCTVKEFKREKGVDIKSHKASVSAQYGDYVKIGTNSMVTSDCEIGEYSYLRNNVCIENTSIGKFCSIAPGVRINPGNHHTDRISTYPMENLFNIPEVNLNK